VQARVEPWVRELKSLHERYASGALPPAERPAYVARAEEVLALVADSQNREVRPGQKRRRTPRIERAVQVDVVAGGRRERTMTIDLGAGGCAVLLGSAPAVGERATVRIRVDAAHEVETGATVAAVRGRKGKHVRVSFAFDPLPPDAAARVVHCVLGHVLSDLWRYRDGLEPLSAGAARPAAGPAVPAGALQPLEEELAARLALDAIALPPYPAVAMKVQQLVARGDFDFADVAGLVGSDPSLAADVLRCANSALYSRGVPTASLPQALTRIGTDQVLRLALSSGVSPLAQRPGRLASLRRALWIESLAGAVICQELAFTRGLRADEAFVLGLLHDFGKVVVCSCLEAVHERRGDVASQPAERWAALLERHHVAAGELLAERWSLSSLVRDVVARHHGPDDGGAEDPALLEVVRASDEVVALLTRSPRVTSADLAFLPRMRDQRERDLVARTIELLPAFVAAFEPAPAAGDGGPSLVAPATELAPGERAVSFGVTLTLARSSWRYAAIAMASNGLVLRGAQAVPENQLVEATLESSPRLRLWAVAKLSRREGDAVRVELKPFGLSGEARGAWDALYASAAPGRPAPQAA
jgi:HD-like signal output (HDOD) protein